MRRDSMTAIETPCVKICALDPRARLCTGCGRTIEEIARWATLTPGDRRRIMAELPARLAEHRIRRADAADVA